jgi:cell division septal protein FtsQ
MTVTTPDDQAGRIAPKSRIPTFRAGAAALLRTGRLPAGLVSLGCLIILFGLLFSADYPVRQIDVRGVVIGDPAEIALAADVLDSPIFTTNPDQAAARVAELPYVARVEVEPSLPDRVVIEVTEREPVLVWQATGSLLLIDRFGHVLATTGDSQLPRLIADGDAPIAGDRVSIAVVAAFLAVEQAFSDRAHTTHLTARDGLVIQLPDQQRVVLGDPDRIPMKLAVVAEFERQGTAEWSLLDVREPSRPAVQ